ncbi:MAG: metal ABC transporter permease [Cyanobacteria bacterium J06621_8]
MWEWFLEPLRYEFMVNAILVGVTLGVLCAVVGSYMIVQQLGMMAHAISHSLVAGLPIAFVLGYSLSSGAIVAGILSAIFMAWIESRCKIKLDTALAIMLSSFLALGVVLVSVLPGANRIDLVHVLFGDILGVNQRDLWNTLITALVILVAVVLFYKELLFYTFDPLGAQAGGMPVQIYYVGMISAITITIVASLETVGSLLVIAMLVGPASTAYLLVKELNIMMILGSFFGVTASAIGMYLSYYFDTPSGASIVLVMSIFFMLAFLFSPSQGILTEPHTPLGKLFKAEK